LAANWAKHGGFADKNETDLWTCHSRSGNLVAAVGVIPAKAGIQQPRAGFRSLDTRLRGYDGPGFGRHKARRQTRHKDEPLKDAVVTVCLGVRREYLLTTRLRASRGRLLIDLSGPASPRP